MHRTRNFYVAEICVNRIVATLSNLNLRPTTRMLTRCTLSDCSVLDKCPWESPGIYPGNLLEIWWAGFV